MITSPSCCPTAEVLLGISPRAEGNPLCGITTLGYIPLATKLALKGRDDDQRCCWEDAGPRPDAVSIRVQSECQEDACYAIKDSMVCNYLFSHSLSLRIYSDIAQ